MNDISLSEQLNMYLERTELKVKSENGMILDKSDIKYVFSLLKQHDLELAPVLCIIEDMINFMVVENLFEANQYIRDIFKYYNIIDNDNLIKCRHLIVLSEKRNKTIKKRFFDEKKINWLRNKLEERDILKKI